MRIAYFDMCSGISGDMTLAACVSAGVPFDTLKNELQKLSLPGYDIEMRHVKRSMISAVKIDVTEHRPAAEHASPSETADAHGHPADHTHDTQHTHEHPSHDTQHAHSHKHGEVAHEHHAAAAHAHGGTRSWLDIEHLISASALSPAVKDRALAMFLTLANAEARVHGTTVDKVHFHEVGAVDSIVDIVGIAICLDLLGVDRVYSSPVRTGGNGLITTQHGVMPVPAPATLEVLKGYPVEFTAQTCELTTPTGATVIATLSSGVLDPRETLTVSAIGYGAGGREIPGLPNILRLLIGEIDNPVEAEQLVLIETTIDDMNPELYPWVIDRLIAEGAFDAWVQAVLMKKGRPGHIITALAPQPATDALVALLYAETTTTGVRIQPVQRRKLERSIERIETRYGAVSVKVIGSGELSRRVPEFEECRRIAKELNLPLLQVYRCIEQDCGTH